MLKKPAVLAFMFCVIPFSHANNRAPTPSTTQGQKAANSTTPAVVQVHRNSNLQQDGPHQAANEPQTVRVILPAKDNYDRFAFWISVTLAAVGLVGIVVAVCTLRAISRQADLMKQQADVMSAQAGHMKEQTDILRDSVAAAKESADAAKTSAQAAMGVSVPTLRLSGFSLEGRPFADVRATLRSPMVGITLKNYGQSPAFLKSYSVIITCEDLPEEPDYAPIQFSPERAIDAGKESTIGNASIPKPETSAEDIEALINRTKYITVYGYVRFGDVFGSPLRDLKFCKRLVSFGPARWNPAILDWHSPNYTGQSPN
jgi:hypothetical protein